LEKNIVTLTFKTNKFKKYTTYLIIENKKNGNDMKLIKISMDCVSDYISSSKKYFNILVKEKNIEDCNEILLGDVYLNSLIKHKYIDIINLVDFELIFKLSTNIKEDDNFELLFSLSETSLKTFNNLTVEPNGRVRVYILFKPLKMIIKNIEIAIKCKILKDFQKSIILKLNPLLPNFIVSIRQLSYFTNLFNENFEFPNFLKTKEDTLIKNEEEVIPFENKIAENRKFQSQKVLLKNVSNGKLKIIIKSNTYFFKIEPLNTVINLNENEIFEINVVPNENIFNSKYKYIEEHFTIYNLNEFLEKILIKSYIKNGTINLTFNGTELYVYSSLEGNIHNFLSRFKKFSLKYIDKGLYYN
jgi:hypothetical protein